jgi:hypothetical protein
MEGSLKLCSGDARGVLSPGGKTNTSLGSDGLLRRQRTRSSSGPRRQTRYKCYAWAMKAAAARPCLLSRSISVRWDGVLLFQCRGRLFEALSSTVPAHQLLRWRDFVVVSSWLEYSPKWLQCMCQRIAGYSHSRELSLPCLGPRELMITSQTFICNIAMRLYTWCGRSL